MLKIALIFLIALLPPLNFECNLIPAEVKIWTPICVCTILMTLGFVVWRSIRPRVKFTVSN